MKYQIKAILASAIITLLTSACGEAPANTSTQNQNLSQNLQGRWMSSPTQIACGNSITGASMPMSSIFFIISGSQILINGTLSNFTSTGDQITYMTAGVTYKFSYRWIGSSLAIENSQITSQCPYRGLSGPGYMLFNRY